MSPARPSRRQVQWRRRVAGVALALIAAVAAYLILAATVFAPVNTHGADVAHLTIQSKAVGEDLEVAVVLPEGTSGEPDKRPLLVFLHGRSGTADTYTEDETFFRSLARLGDRAPVVAFPHDDGNSYWHNRDTGNWGSYVIDEVIPKVAEQFDADPERVAIGGISMGGFGAYNLALHNPGRFCAVGGHSPALWLEGGDTAPGAFDDAEDFERNDVIEIIQSDPGAFGPIPIWNDAGAEDPFLISDVAFNEALEAAGANLAAHIWPGEHDHAYWDRHWSAYLRFYSQALAQC